MNNAGDRIEFIVEGRPVPAGSKNAYPVRRKDGSLVMKPGKNGRPSPVINVADDSKKSDAKRWRRAIREAAREAWSGVPFPGAVMLAIRFEIPRPKLHYYTGVNAGVLHDKAPLYVGKAPDGLKLRRGVEDALNGFLWKDDSLVWRGAEEKVWIGKDEPYRTVVTITPMLHQTIGDVRIAQQPQLAAA